MLFEGWSLSKAEIVPHDDPPTRCPAGEKSNKPSVTTRQGRHNETQDMKMNTSKHKRLLCISVGVLFLKSCQALERYCFS
jgi:hypothetical protein